MIRMSPCRETRPSGRPVHRADLSSVDVGAPEAKAVLRTMTAADPESRELVDEDLGQAVAQVLAIGVRSHVLEGQHGYRVDHVDAAEPVNGRAPVKAGRSPDPPRPAHQGSLLAHRQTDRAVTIEPTASSSDGLDQDGPPAARARDRRPSGSGPGALLQARSPRCAERRDPRSVPDRSGESVFRIAFIVSTRALASDRSHARSISKAPARGEDVLAGRAACPGPTQRHEADRPRNHARFRGQDGASLDLLRWTIGADA